MELQSKAKRASLAFLAIMVALIAFVVATFPKPAIAASDNVLIAGQSITKNDGIEIQALTEQSVLKSQATAVTLKFNQQNINKVGKQAKNSCACLCYAYAYMDTITSGIVHYWNNYTTRSSEQNAYADKNAPSMTFYRQTSQQSALKTAYDGLSAGKPVIVYVNQKNGGQHWVLLVGYKNVTNPNSLSTSNFLMLDPVNGASSSPESLGLRGYTIRNDGSTKNVRVSNKTVSIDSVIPVETAKAPSIGTPISVPGGADVVISDLEGGATITYNLDNGSTKTFTGSRTERLSKAHTRIAAYATKQGRLQSTTSTRDVSLSTTATPKLEKTDMAGGATISLDSAGNGETIYYTIDGSEPAFNVATGQGTGTKYTAAFTLTQNATIKAIAVRSGELVSGKLVQEVTVVPPVAPSDLTTYVGSKAADKLAVDDAITVKWNENKTAASYIATLYNESGDAVETSTVKAAQVVFTPSNSGRYTVGVKAVNVVGESEESERVEFEAKDPCLVKFVDKIADEQGNITTKVLDKQLVRYGYSAERPAVPVKRGYTFAGWDRDTPLTNITKSDYEIIANWQINTYTVRFLKADGKTTIKTQSVEFGSPATPPTPPEPEDGYVFSGWTIVEADDDSERNIDSVDSPMKVKAVYAWADQELPVVLSITNAKRNSRVYTVDVNVKNNPTTATTAWLRVSLKTASGKLVQSTKETISLPAAGAETDHRVTLKYEEGGYIASKAEAEVVAYVGDNRTGGAYSKAVFADVVSADDYELATSASEWSTAQPSESENYVIESEKQYRYQDKQTTTSTSSALEGWLREGDPVTTYGSWGSKQSTTSRPAVSDTLEWVDNPTTKYTYYRYCNYYDGQWQQDSIPYGSSSVYHEVTLDGQMASCANRFGDQGGKAWDLHGPHGSCSHKVTGQSFWWSKSTTTTYYYHTRTKTVTYGYYRWGEWSEWSSEPVESSDTRNVEERTVYRTRAKIFNAVAGTEDTSGETYTISGKFDDSMQVAGKEATIMVYNVTNSDPNEDQIQYIGQTTINADNSYSFSFIPKKEPSADTGDFIVSLGVKGSTGLVNVDKIEAPDNEHKVIYLYTNASGEEITVSEQFVADGKSAEVPDPPTVEGAQFQRWSASTTSVTNDMTVTALYSTETYAVAWVDWVNGGVFLETKAHGEELTAPVENPIAKGYTFIGWDALLDGRTSVTGNTVINAVYEPEKYTVMFADATGGVFATQQVAYGEAATLPDGAPTAEGMEFVAWDTTAGTPWWNVTENMIVKPLFAYEGTTSSPFSKTEIAEGYVSAKGYKTYLETATEGAKIYYTTDGSDPVAVESESTQGKRSLKAAGSVSKRGSDEEEPPVEITARLYDEEEGITITEPTTIRAIAVMDGMNDSSISEIDVNVTATNDVANAEAGVSEAPFFYGEAVEPGVMVWLGDEPLTLDEDYTVEYSNNTAVGTGVAVVKGKGSYIGTQTIEFEIIEAPQDDEAGDGGDNPSGGNDPSGGDKPSTPTNTEKVGAPNGTVVAISGVSYKVASNDLSTVVYQKAPKSKKSVVVPASVKINGKSYKVVGIAKNAFKGSKAKTVTVKSKKLTKKSVKGCFKGAKNLKTVKVKVGSKKLNKKYVKKYKKIFTKKNCGKKVTVK